MEVPVKPLPAPAVKPGEPVLSLPAPPKPSPVPSPLDLDVPPPLDLATDPAPLPPPPAKPAVPATPTSMAKTEPPALPPGDLAMIKSISHAALVAILGGAVTASPVKAEPAAPVDEVLKKQIEENNKKLDENNKLIAEMKEQLKDLSVIRERIYGRKDQGGNEIPNDRGLLKDMQRLNDQVDALRQQVEKMGTEYKALKPSTPPASPETKIVIPGTMPPGPGSTPAIAGKGTIRLVNDYPVEISMVINKDLSYKIGAHSVKSIDVPAGEFTYELLQGGAGPVKSTIKEKEIVTLRVK